jgi:hypothetical protein
LDTDQQIRFIDEVLINLSLLEANSLQENSSVDHALSAVTGLILCGLVIHGSIKIKEIWKGRKWKQAAITLATIGLFAETTLGAKQTKKLIRENTKEIRKVLLSLQTSIRIQSATETL